MLKSTRENDYDGKGMYKGIKLTDELLQEFKSLSNPQLDDRETFLLDHFNKSKLNPIQSGHYIQNKIIKWIKYQ